MNPCLAGVFAVATILLGGCGAWQAPPTVASAAPAAAPSTPGVVRQYYGAWKRAPQGFFYRPYYFKPKMDYAGFKHHLVVYRPDKPAYLFFFNPYTKTFWGRCASQGSGQPLYSLLPESQRQRDLDAIPETAFPPPGALPPIPESTDQVKIDLPPDDLEVAAGGEF